MILYACILRLGISGVPGTVKAWMMDNPLPLFSIFSETGRNVRFSASSEVISDHFRESPAPWIQKPDKAGFVPGDLDLVEVDYDCDRRPDLEALLTRPLDWNLKGESPTVLILHTHTTESYTKSGEKYEETARFRTLSEGHNMLSVGDAVTEILTAAGIGVIHDRAIHDYPSYNGSYVHSRSAAEQILEEYPSVCLVLDLHRDALETTAGTQLRTLAQVKGMPSAQLMIVVGTDVTRSAHENWEENLSLALKLHVQLERLSPGIMRPLNLRAQRFNQDLSPGALLVEVGAAGNTRQEALAAAAQLAEAIVSLAEGTE